MEESDTIKSGLSAIRQVIPLFRSLIERAPQQGASEEFTRQLNEAVIEMQQAVIDAQEMVLAGQSAEAKLRSRLQDLERRSERAEEWSKEIARYRLVDLGESMGMAYALRKEFIAEDLPLHYLCTNCSEDGIKSILQSTGMDLRPFVCPRCRR